MALNLSPILEHLPYPKPHESKANKRKKHFGTHNEWNMFSKSKLLPLSSGGCVHQVCNFQTNNHDLINPLFPQLANFFSFTLNIHRNKFLSTTWSLSVTTLIWFDSQSKSVLYDKNLINPLFPQLANFFSFTLNIHRNKFLSTTWSLSVTTLIWFDSQSKSVLYDKNKKPTCSFKS